MKINKTRTLKGSEKQVKFASDIREKMIDFLEEELEELEDTLDNNINCNKELCEIDKNKIEEILNLIKIANTEKLITCWNWGGRKCNDVDDFKIKTLQ